MSWAEFIIRSLGFKRKREFEMMMYREVAYASYVSGWMGKSKPPSKQKFWPIGEQKVGLTDEMKQAFLKAKEQYRKDKEKNG